MIEKNNKRLICRSIALLSLVCLFVVLAVSPCSANGAVSTDYTTGTTSGVVPLLVTYKYPYYGQNVAYLPSTWLQGNSVSTETLNSPNGATVYDMGSGRAIAVGFESEEMVNKSYRYKYNVVGTWAESITPPDTLESIITIKIPYIVIDLSADTYSQYLVEYFTSDENASLSWQYEYEIKYFDNITNETFGEISLEYNKKRGQISSQDTIYMFPEAEYPPNTKYAIITDYVLTISTTVHTHYILEGAGGDEIMVSAPETAQYITVTTPQYDGIDLSSFLHSAEIDYSLFSFNDFSIVDWASTQINSMLNAPIFGLFGLGSLLLLMIGIGVLFFILKAFLGG